MDKRIRKNEVCIINLPSCDYVFSSTRSCFVAYGFQRSALEMGIIEGLLKDRGIEPIEAGGALAPGQYAFCTKICSKIITAQFCIVLLNNEMDNGIEKPNANVNMEYGLMLGFNKYIIPFQQKGYKLPFNVSGLDTIVYDQVSFKTVASKAIDQAIVDTKQSSPSSPDVSQDVGAYLLLKGALVLPLDTPGPERDLFRLGSVCGFNLCGDLEGIRYIYFGNFTNLRPNVIAWRTQKLVEIWKARLAGIEQKLTLGLINEAQRDLVHRVAADLQIWVLTNTAEDRRELERLLGTDPSPTIFTSEEVAAAVAGSGMI